MWTVLARIAEDKGEWEAASRAWEASSERRDGAAKAADLVSAAVAAHVGSDDARHDALLDVARDADPEHPRVRLEDLPEDASPAEQLAELDGLESDDPDTRMLIAARSALASLRLPDLDRAFDYLQVAQEVGPDTALTQAVQANALVQKARLNLTASQSLDGPELRTAHNSALQVRARLLRQRRWGESARLLMLAADTLALLDERKEGAQLLRQATPEERAAPDAAEVLGDCAASRVLDFRLALEFLEGAPESTVIKRIRAEAKEEVGTAAERAEALKVLEDLVDADGDESTEAAFIRLAATLGGRRTPWSDSAAAYLREHGHERAAITAEVIYLARWHKDWPRIEALLEPHLDEMWAKVTRLRVAITRRQHTMIRDAAGAVMVAGPSQATRVDAGRGYAMAGDYARAKEVLLGPAREPSAPPLLRAEAYRLLMRVVGHGLDDWQFAAELHQEWVALRPTDTNVSAWAPTIANRRRQT